MTTTTLHGSEIHGPARRDPAVPDTKPANRPERVYLHPLPVRIWHWVNALGFVLLILTGTQIRYADLIGLVSFETAVKLHNWTGFVVIAAWFLWFGFNITSERVTSYHPELHPRSFFEHFFRQMRYYGYGIFRGEQPPHRVQPFDKFNAMQKVTYLIMMFFAAPVTIVTGLAMWDVQRFAGLIDWLGGIRVVNTIHVVMYIVFVFFILVHAYMGFLGPRPSSHYKEMFTGYEEPHE